jgi:hypothetical protein
MNLAERAAITTQIDVSATGEVPDDAVLGNGLNLIQSYQQTDFNALNLSLPL